LDDSRCGPTTPDRLSQAALKELIGEKLAGNLPERPPERETAQVINLMDALKRSLAEEGDLRASKSPKARHRKVAAAYRSQRAPGRRRKAS